MVKLAQARDKKPAQLSGGMRQRVSVARALAMDPEVLLMDEPLGALDALTRATLQDELAAHLARQRRKTVLLITNDVDEGILLADRIIPLSAGPRATLGPGITVDIERPRDRKALNHDPRFKEIRRRGDRATCSRPGAGPRRGRGARPVKRGARRRSHEEVPRDMECHEDLPTPRGPLRSSSENFDLNLEEGRVPQSSSATPGAASPPCYRWSRASPRSRAAVSSSRARQIHGPGPDRGVVFQSPCLLHWMTALENVLLGVEQVHRQKSKKDCIEIATHYLELVGLEESIHKKPRELSSGMQQRVGLARAFALSPKMLLLDEPFGMLDSLTRFELQEVLMNLWAEDHKTALMVTHDVDEALFLSDRIAMMTNGPGARVGEILEVPFPHPRDRQEVLEDPMYYPLRERLITFLEGQAHKEKPAAESARESVPEGAVEVGEVLERALEGDENIGVERGADSWDTGSAARQASEAYERTPQRAERRGACPLFSRPAQRRSLVEGLLWRGRS